ncbi:hypothetical protein ES708_13129 [subsurface metagenome]
MDWDEAKVKLEGLSEAQLELLIQLTFGWLPEVRQDLMVRLAGQMRRVNEQTKKGG